MALQMKKSRCLDCVLSPVGKCCDAYSENSKKSCSKPNANEAFLDNLILHSSLECLCLMKMRLHLHSA